MIERVTTVTISGKVDESNSDNTVFSFSVNFIPPDPISGKVSYLQVKSFFVNEDNETEATNFESTWLLNLDWTQPNSVSYIYDEMYNSTSGRSNPRKASSNQTVATMTKLTNSHTCQTEHPRCLVDIPFGPHPLKVTAQRVTDGTTDFSLYNVWGITFTAEIVPIDSF